MGKILPACPLRLANNQTDPTQDFSIQKNRCGSSSVIRKGFFQGALPSNPEEIVPIQRYKCKSCGRFFSDRTLSEDYRQRNSNINDILESHLMSGVSQRRAALLLGIGRETVARRLPFFAAMARKCQNIFLEALGPRRVVQFDEMRSFEHTKMKPLFLPLIVDEESKVILGMDVARAPADGLLAERSRKKYGLRVNEKSKVRKALLERLHSFLGEEGIVKSDEESNYPRELAAVFPKREHRAFKGRKACVVGQGELKVGGRDPLFALNHAAAMVRDNVKRLSRRSWCTTKKPECLRYLLEIYTWFHNSELVARRKRMKRIANLSISI